MVVKNAERKEGWMGWDRMGWAFFLGGDASGCMFDGANDLPLGLKASQSHRSACRVDPSEE